MSGTDVAEEQETEGTAEETKSGGGGLGMLKIWLPFPLILGALLFFQFQQGKLAKPEVEEVVPPAFEGAGPELPRLLAALEEERGEIEVEREDLRFAARRLILEASEVEKRQKEVEAILAQAEAKIEVMEEERERMINQLAKVYETMKPDAAAEIIAEIDLDTSTEILNRMKERNAAQVMASLTPEAAARISQRMLRAR